MRRRVYLLALFVGLLVIPASHAHGEATLQEQYLKIYLQINNAQVLEEKGDFRGALALFQDCYSRLAKVHRDQPDWERALVLRRMEDCRAKVMDLKVKVESMPAVAPSPAPVPLPPIVPIAPSTNAAPIRPVTPSPAVPSMSVLPDDIPALKKRVRDVEEQLRQTKDTLRESQVQVDTYRVRLDSVNTQLQALKSTQSTDGKVDKLLSENKALTDKLTVAQTQLDDFKKNPKSKLAQVQVQLKNLQDQLDASQSANATLQQSLTNLQQRLDQSQGDLVAANQRLATISPASPDYATAKRENELLRGVLQREMQEQAHRDQAKRLYQEEFDRLKIKSDKLQELADEMASAMSPPATEEERALLNTLKTSGPDVVPPPGTGNTFSAPAAGSTNSTGAIPPDSASTGEMTNPAAVSPAMADASLAPNNAPVIKSDDPPPPAPAPAPPAPLVPPVSTPPDANAVGPVPPDGATNPVTPVMVAENSVKTPSPAAAQGSNTAATVTHIAPPVTNVTDTTVTPGGGDNVKQPDPTQYSWKARLPEDMRDTAQQASDFFNMKRYDEAAAKYQVIIDKYPESLYAWSNLGVVRFQQGDLNDALKALQQAVKISPTDAFSYSNLGIVYYNLNQYENAIDALNTAKGLDPKDAKIRNYLGCACSQKGWQEVAEKEFRAAIEIDPNFADAHFNLALVYATQKPRATELARREYQKARDLGIAKDDRLEKLLQPDQ